MAFRLLQQRTVGVESRPKKGRSFPVINFSRIIYLKCHLASRPPEKENLHSLLELPSSACSSPIIPLGSATAEWDPEDSFSFVSRWTRPEGRGRTSDIWHEKAIKSLEKTENSCNYPQKMEIPSQSLVLWWRLAFGLRRQRNFLPRLLLYGLILTRF